MGNVELHLCCTVARVKRRLSVLAIGGAQLLGIPCQVAAQQNSQQRPGRREILAVPRELEAICAGDLILRKHGAPA